MAIEERLNRESIVLPADDQEEQEDDDYRIEYEYGEEWDIGSDESQGQPPFISLSDRHPSFHNNESHSTDSNQ